jgi:hypothetical protein
MRKTSKISCEDYASARQAGAAGIGRNAGLA